MSHNPHPNLHPQALSRDSVFLGRPTRYSIMEPVVDDPDSTLISFNRQFGLNAREKEAVERVANGDEK